MKEDSKYIEMNIADTVMERPYGFKVSEHQFYLYPVTLGKTFLIARLVETLDVNREIIETNPYMEALRLCQDKKETVCRLLSYHTLEKREELFDNLLVSERCSFFQDNLPVDDMAQLLVMALSEDDVHSFLKHLGLDRDRKELEKISKIKDSKGGSITFGGKSVFGSLILPACEKLNMTPRQVVWDISYAFLRMLMADTAISVHLTDEERRKAHISTDGVFINADTPANIAKIRAMRWD